MNAETLKKGRELFNEIDCLRKAIQKFEDAPIHRVTAYNTSLDAIQPALITKDETKFIVCACIDSMKRRLSDLEEQFEKL